MNQPCSPGIPKELDILQMALEDVDVMNHDDRVDAINHGNQVDYENSFLSDQEVPLQQRAIGDLSQQTCTFTLLVNGQPTSFWPQSQNAVSEAHTVSLVDFFI